MKYTSLSSHLLPPNICLPPDISEGSAQRISGNMWVMLLVTGGAGFIGSHLVDRLLDRDYEVVCVDDFNDFYDPEIKRDNVRNHLLSGRYKLVEGDIRNQELMSKIFSDYPIERIVHLAARAGV